MLILGIQTISRDVFSRGGELKRAYVGGRSRLCVSSGIGVVVVVVVRCGVLIILVVAMIILGGEGWLWV